MKRIALFAFFLFIYSTPNPGDANSGILKYSNVEYGFAVVLPSGLSHEESRPPAPQHGTVIQLGTGARIWIDLRKVAPQVVEGVGPGIGAFGVSTGVGERN